MDAEMNNPCMHDDNCKYTLITNLKTGEVYMCECGALIDLRADKNFRARIVMTPDELMERLREDKNTLLERVLKATVDALDTEIQGVWKR